MIKKIFQILGIVSVICFSFFYTEKAVTVLKEQDPIMQKILAVKDKYNIVPINAELIDKNYVIPGYNGKQIDVDRSYNSMKRLGQFNDNLFIYHTNVPEISIKHMYDRYIIKGNKVKKMISLVFKINGSDNVETVLTILDNNDVKASFFLDGKWLEENIDTVREIIKKGHELSNLGYDSNYDVDYFIWTNNKIKQMYRQKTKYCYVDDDDFTILNLCRDYGMYTIKPTINTNNYPFNEVKTKLESGSIISFDINNIVANELNMIIKFIKSKGYKIAILSEHLSEKRL